MNNTEFINEVRRSIDAMRPFIPRREAVFCIRDVVTDSDKRWASLALRSLAMFGEVELSEYRDMECSTCDDMIVVKFTPFKVPQDDLP